MGIKNKILVIEDDLDISNLICMNLEAAGYQSYAVYDGNQVLELLSGKEDYDLALLDMMLPGQDGFSLIAPLSSRHIPVICLTAKGDVCSKVQGLKLGAEDYMVKPFEILELLVRMEKVLERCGKRTNELVYQSLFMDLKRCRVMEDGVEISLKPMEFRLLKVFLQNRNIVLGREKLLELVWGEEFYGETRTVDVHVAKLRKKIKACSGIVTIPKGGYLLEDDEI